MSNYVKQNLFFLLLMICLSCAEKKIAQEKLPTAEISKPLVKEGLIFTSGIRSILKDSNGNYWFGSHNEGLCRFDGTSYTYFTVDDGLASNQVRSIQEHTNGTIWFGTDQGVSSFDGSKITKHTVSTVTSIPSVWTKSESDLWFDADTKEGVYRYDGQKVSYLAFPVPKIKNSSYAMTCQSAGHGDVMWFGTYAGVVRFDGAAPTVINDQTLQLNEQTGLLHVRSILEDSKGRLWIGNNGIGVLLKEGEEVVNFSEGNNLIHFMSSRSGAKSPAGTLEHVFAIEEDPTGNIWFGDRDTGIWKYDGQNVVNYTVDEKSNSPMIWTIYYDGDRLLAGRATGGVYAFNGKSFDPVF